MAQSTFSIRMDENLKREFDNLCVDFGMNATTAFNVFARAVVREKKIPFEIMASNTISSIDVGRNAFLSLRKQALNSDISDLSLEQVNEEIGLARAERDNL